LPDAISAETLARTTADGLANTAISTGHGCNNSRSLAKNNGRWSQNTAISNNTDAISAETSLETDGLQNTAISNNTDAITAEATTRADAITAEALARTADGVQKQLSNNTDAITAEAIN
jgi:hypothetical protein